MEPQVFSRSYLQSLPEIKKKKLADDFLKCFELYIIQAASNGETSYFYDITHVVFKDPTMIHQQAVRTDPDHNFQWFTMDELVEFVKEKFPGCSVTLTQKFVNTKRNIPTLNKGILVDWS